MSNLKTKYADSNTKRNELSSMNGKLVRCRAKFAGVNIKTNRYGDATTVLFREILIDGEIECGHVWVWFNKNFKNLDIKLGCIMEFDAIVEKYKHEEKFGLGTVSNIRIVEDGEFEDKLSLRIGSVKYDKRCSQLIENSTPAHIQFLKDFGISSGDKVELKYKKLLGANKAINLAIFVNGKESSVDAVFNPEVKHGLSVGGYFIPVKEEACRTLSMIYFRHGKVAAA